MLTGDDRIKADRMWRNPTVRKQFEKETNTPPLDSFYNDIAVRDYETRFNNWAEMNIPNDLGITLNMIKNGY